MQIDLVKYYMTKESFKKTLKNLLHTEIPKGYIEINAKKDVQVTAKKDDKIKDELKKNPTNKSKKEEKKIPINKDKKLEKNLNKLN